MKNVTVRAESGWPSGSGAGCPALAICSNAAGSRRFSPFPGYHMVNNEIVQKLWNRCDVLRDDGINYSDYVTRPEQ